MKDGKKLKLGDAHVTPRYVQEVHASKLGDAQGIPIFINKTSGHFTRHYIFIAPYTMCCSWSVSCFCFQFSLVCLLQYLVGSHQCLFWRETRSVFIAITLQYSLLLFCECSLLLVLRLALVFHSCVFQSLLVFFFCFLVRLLDSLSSFSLRLVSNKSIGVGKEQNVSCIQ